MKILVQGGYVVGFNGREHEIIQNGVVVFERDRILFVGREYAEPVDKKIEAQGCLVSPGFIDTHFHSGINASDYLLNEPDKLDFFASNYLAHGAPTREGAKHAHLKDVDVGQRFSMIHILKSGVTTTLEIGGPGADPEPYVEMVGEVGIRCYTGPSYKNVNFFHDREGRLEYDWSDERGSEDPEQPQPGEQRPGSGNRRHHNRNPASPCRHVCEEEKLDKTRSGPWHCGIGRHHF